MLFFFEKKKHLVLSAYLFSKKYSDYLKYYSKNKIDDIVKKADVYFSGFVKIYFKEKIKFFVFIFISLSVIISSVNRYPSKISNFFKLAYYNQGKIKIKYKLNPENSVIVEKGQKFTPELILFDDNYKNIKLLYRGAETRQSINNLKRKKEKKTDKYFYIFKNVLSDFSYYFLIDDYKTDKVNVYVKNKLFIDIEKVKIIYPEYTLLKDEQIDKKYEFSVLQNSLLKFYLKSNKKVLKTNLYVNEKEYEYENLKKIITIKANKNKKIKIKITDEDNFTAETKEIFIKVNKDKKPRVEILFPKDNSKVPDDKIIVVNSKFIDDFGLSKLFLFIKINDARQNKVKILFDKNIPASDFSYLLDASKFNLFPSDKITIYIKAVDNDKYNPKTGISNIVNIFMPSFKEMFEAESVKRKMNNTILEAMYQKTKQQIETLKQASDALEKEGKLDFQASEKINKMIEELKQQQTQVENIAQRIKQRKQDIMQNNLLNKDLLFKLQKINELMSKFANKNLKESMKKLQQALSEVNLTEQQKALMNAQFDLQKYSENIEKTYKALKNLENKQILYDALKTMNDVIKKHNEIFNEFKKGAKPSANTDKLKKNFNEYFKKLKEKIENMQDKELKQDLKKILKDFDRQKFDQNMKELSEAYKNNNDKKAGQKYNETKKQLEKMKKGLEKSLQQNIKNEYEQISDEIDRIMDKLLTVSRKEYHLADDLKSLNSYRFSYLDTEESRKARKNLLQASELKGGMGFAVLKLNEIAIKTLSVEIKTIEKLLSALKDLEQIEDIGAQGRFFNLYQYSNNSRNKIIEVVLDLFNLKKNMQQKSKSNSSVENLMDSLEQLSEMQQQLNQQIQQMLSSSPSITQQLLQQMAFQQQLIRKSLESLSKRLSETGKVLSDFNDIIDKMKDIEKKIKKGEINKDLEKKQKDVLDKLLQATKSLKEKNKESKKRKSDIGKEYLLDKQKQEQLKKYYEFIMKNLNEYPEEYRDIIMRYYYEIINN